MVKWCPVNGRLEAVEDHHAAARIVAPQRFHRGVFGGIGEGARRLHVRKFDDDHARRRPQVGFEHVHIATAHAVHAAELFRDDLHPRALRHSASSEYSPKVGALGDIDISTCEACGSAVKVIGAALKSSGR